VITTLNEVWEPTVLVKVGVVAPGVPVLRTLLPGPSVPIS